MTNSSAYTSSHGDPRRQSWDNASITITNVKGLKNLTLVNSHLDAKLFTKGVVYTDT